MSEENVAAENLVEQSTSDERELDLMELEVYRKAWEEINSALADIFAMRGKKSADVDPMQYVRSEVANLKKNFAELKDAIVNMQKPMENAQAQQPAGFRAIQPTIPLMPYYQTPSFAPIIQVPQQN